MRLFGVGVEEVVDCWFGLRCSTAEGLEFRIAGLQAAAQPHSAPTTVHSPW